MVGTGAERILPGAIAQDPEGVVSSAISWASRTSVLIGDWMLAYNISGNADERSSASSAGHDGTKQTADGEAEGPAEGGERGAVNRVE